MASAGYSKRSRIIWLACFAGLTFIVWTFTTKVPTREPSLFEPPTPPDIVKPVGIDHTVGTAPVITPPPDTLRRKYVAVASDFGAHFDVWLAAVKTLRNVIKDQGEVQVYAEEPGSFRFGEVTQELDLFNGEYRSKSSLVAAMYSTTMFREPHAMIDLIVFGTCEIDMAKWSVPLVAAWDARPADQKFKIVCIVHNFGDNGWHHHMDPWAARGAIRLLPISRHVGRAFDGKFKELSDDPGSIAASGGGYEYVKFDVHVPVLDLAPLPSRQSSSKLSRVALQGFFDSNFRRDYAGVMSDFLSALREDPRSWGYLPPADETSAFVVDPESAEPFSLHLVGNGDIEIPPPLRNAVTVHKGLEYPDFYALIKSMDLILPAFASKGYYESQASSTVVMALECNVPILATRRMRAAYAHLDDDRVVVTRPQALRELAAVQVLREGRFDAPAGRYSAEVVAAVEEMLDRGWKRPTADYTAYLQDLRRSNEEGIRRILMDQ